MIKQYRTSNKEIIVQISKSTFTDNIYIPCPPDNIQTKHYLLACKSEQRAGYDVGPPVPLDHQTFQKMSSIYLALLAIHSRVKHSPSTSMQIQEEESIS